MLIRNLIMYYDIMSWDKVAITLEHALYLLMVFIIVFLLNKISVTLFGVYAALIIYIPVSVWGLKMLEYVNESCTWRIDQL